MADQLTAPAEVVAYANELALLPFWAEFDAENALTQYREKLYKQLGIQVDVEGFKQLWLILGYDKVTSAPVAAAAPAEGGEAAPAAEGEAAPPAEGEGEAAAAPAEGGAAASAPAAEGEAVPAADAAPAAPVETTSNYKLVWSALTKDATSDRVSVQSLIGSIILAKGGYSEATFRAILKAGDHEGKGCASEEAAFTAVTLCANRRDGVNQLTRAHVRKAWRKAEKYAPAPAEGEAPPAEEGEEAPPAAPAVPIDPAAIAVLMDSFVEALQGDELLAEVLLKEVPVPIKEPEAAPEAAEE